MAEQTNGGAAANSPATLSGAGAEGLRQSPAPDHAVSKRGLRNVQCNLRINVDLRDALHLQALRERRSIAALVTEVMSGYLNDKGTFNRLR